MIARVITWALKNPLVVVTVAILLAAWGIYSARTIPPDAIPDLSDVQIIVKTPYPGQAPRTVEDQVTYPLTTALLSVPGSTAVRGFSMFGESYVYVLFKDGTDPYWARSRVLEYLNQLRGTLPPGVHPQLGPDASGVGWILEYALVDRHHRYDPDQLRNVQDFFLKYELQSLPGVAEVASIGGMTRQFQIEVDPNRLAAYRISMDQIKQAVHNANAATGASVVEMGETEYMVRSLGYLKTLAQLRQVPLGVGANGTVIRLQAVAHIHTGPAHREGVADLDGRGDTAGGIIVMRYGANALDTIAAVKARLAQLKSGLPPGVELVVTYDRSKVILRAIQNLRRKLFEESLAVAVACILFLFHARSAAVAIASLPVAILMAFVVMRQQDVAANIMSLGGIAIAIGTMVDAAIVMIENMHKHLEQAGERPDYFEVARRSALEVGPALFFSLLIITVSFLPILTLTGQEGRLFVPLAYTKTYAMAASAVLAVTLVPVLMALFIRGRIMRERNNPVNRLLENGYRPLLMGALRHPRLTLLLSAGLVISVAWPLLKSGSEFMPPLYEGDLLYMPTTVPGISLDEAANVLQITDRLISTMPEVEHVFGKAGRADTATDPAPLSMLETVIQLKPRSAWPAGETAAALIDKLDRAVRLPGLVNSWGYPIRTRIDMLSTGIRTPVGIKITGPDLAGIAELAQRIETAMRSVPGTRNVFADRVAGGHYLDIDVKRTAAARYGLTLKGVQDLVATAIGGENISTVIDGRRRYPVNLRYMRDFRASLQALGASRVATPSGAQVPLDMLADVRVDDGPAEIKSEGGRLVGYVYVDTAAHDLGGYIKAARRAVAETVKLPPGYAIAWAGQYTNMEHARARFAWIIPTTLLVVLLLLHMHFRDVRKALLVALCVPLSLVGGIWAVYWLHYNLSVAVIVGFIALAGLAAEFGIVMLLFLDHAIARHRREGHLQDADGFVQAIVEGALLRLRPKMMTVAVILAGLLPIMFSHGIGTDVMKRIAAPLVGGMVTAPLLSLILIPVLYLLGHSAQIKSEGVASKSAHTRRAPL